MPDHTVRSLEATLRGMPPDAPIMVNVDGTLRPVALVMPTWVGGWDGGQRGSRGGAICPGHGLRFRGSSDARIEPRA